MKGPRQAGFSLLELLVTLFVIVLVTSLVSLNLSSGGRDVELEARVRNLADVAAYALDEAQMTGRDYGLLLQQEPADGEVVYGFAWRERAAGGWRPPESGKDVFADQSLPPGYELQLELEDSLFRESDLVEGTGEEAPQVVFYASGETTAGSIDVRRSDSGDLLWRIQWDLLGRFSVLPRGEEPQVE
ncbi:MAG: GspH/FimT family pseudopilin [Gammaproteobacteria bacterium]|nr:GspH/FimT family pseudopilin [Gammaproteobacteria bacterium]